jgi:hypothetical protein
MNIKLLAAAASALALSMSGSAMAASVLVGGYTLDDSSFGTGLGVHSDGTQSGSAISGNVNIDGSDVNFSTTNGNLSITGSGEATVYGDPGLENLLVTFEKSWSKITFNFADLDKATSNFTLLVNGTALFSATPNLGDLACTFCVIDKGENKFTVSSAAGINSLAFNFDPAVENAKQFRVEGVITGGVPEPATWAMMIMGFGAVGSMVRHSRRKLASVAA